MNDIIQKLKKKLKIAVSYINLAVQYVAEQPASEKLLYVGSILLIVATMVVISNPDLINFNSDTPIVPTTPIVETQAPVNPTPTEPPTEPSIPFQEEPTIPPETEPVVEETEPGTEETAPVTEEPTNEDTYNTWDEYVGRFKILDMDINVGLYASDTQNTINAKDSAAYFENGRIFIADRADQAFANLDSCTVGTTATLSTGDGEKIYTCIDIMDGYTTSHGLTDNNHVSIANYYPDALVCYTYRAGWQNITIAFFKSNNKEEEIEEIIPCDELEQEHQWGAWKREQNDNDELSEWKIRQCEICFKEERKQFSLIPVETQPSVETPTEDDNSNSENTEE